MIARTIARSLALVPRSRTNRGSILSASTGSVFEMRQNGVAGAEVVDGSLHADVFELGQRARGALDVVDHCALGDLQAQRTVVHAELRDRFGDHPDETRAWSTAGERR